MKIQLRPVHLFLPALAAGLLAAGCASAGDSPLGDRTPEEAMAMVVEMAAPAAPHELLRRMEGTWSAAATMWMEPGGEPQVHQGAMVNTMVLGGRFLQSEYTSETPMGPFQGMGLLGYDRHKERYVGMWIDSMSTMMPPITEGTWEEASQVLTMSGTGFNPLLDRDARHQENTTFVNPDEHVFEMWGETADGKLFRSLRIVYTRAAS